MIDRNKNNIVEFDVGASKLLNIAYKKIDKSEYLNAVPILKKALKEDPQNVDVLLELSLAYSRMDMVDKSNEYAYRALSIGHNETSLYLIGNNFLKIHNYDKGVSYFKRLLSMYPDGEHAEYAEIIASRLEDNGETDREKKLLRLTKKGREFIESGQYKKAVRLFSLLSFYAPNETSIKNNLSMAYFYDGKPEKAIKICKEIFMKKRYDVFANCNLALFYYRQKNKYELHRQKEKLLRIKPATQDEFIKLISTYCDMKCHEEVIRIVKQAAMTYSYDLTYLFFLAAANYNLGNVNKSLSLFHDILKVDEDNYIAYYYIKAINSLMKPKSIDYYNQLPIVAVIDCVKRLRALAEMPCEELRAKWNEESQMVVMWGTKYKDDLIKKISFSILSSVGNEECERKLRSALFSVNLTDDIKKDVLASLRFMDAAQPYAAYFSGDILDVKVSVATIENPKELKRPQKAIDVFKESEAEDFDNDLLKECIDIYVMLLNKGMDGSFRSINALCAAIEISVRELHNISYVKTELVKRYKTTVQTVEKYASLLKSIIEENKKENMKEI